MMTDPIADMLTRLRNGTAIKAERVDIPASRLKLEIAKVLKDEGFIKGYKLLKDRRQGVLRITLKYVGTDETRIMTGLKKVSTPGRRVYVGKDRVPRVMAGVGIAVLSTSKGVMSDRVCRSEGVGGEVLCYVW